MAEANQGLYSKETMSTLMNISERRLEQLSKKKIIPKAGRGVYDLGPTVQAYIRYLQGLCSGAIKAGEPSELDKRLLEAKVLEREQKARQAKIRADVMERDISERDLRKEIELLPERLENRLENHSEYIDAITKQRIMSEIKKMIDGILNGCESP